MKINKAVITAASPTQRQLPLQRLVDRDGVEKTAMQVIVEEVVSAGINEICVVVCPGDDAVYREAAGAHAHRLQFVIQSAPRGYGDALLLSRDFTEQEPILHLVSDHLYLSATNVSCARQLVEVAEEEKCSVSAVQATRESMLPYFGCIGGHRVSRRYDLYEVERVVEKPTPTEAEQNLIIPGLRSGYYLCMFGMHVLTPVVMTTMAELVKSSTDGESVQLADALEKLTHQERYLALETKGARYNIGVKYGLLYAQIATALNGADRDEVLSTLVELLATHPSHASSFAD